MKKTALSGKGSSVRRKILAAGVLLSAGMLMESEYERHALSVTRYQIDSVHLPAQWDGLRLAFISDLHDNEFGRENIRLRQAISDEKPDIVLIGGDQLTVKPWRRRDFSAQREFLSWLSERWPVCYGMGNHEQRMREKAYEGWWEEYEELLRECGVILLDNSSAVCPFPGRDGGKSMGGLRVYGLSVGGRYYGKGKVPVMPQTYLIHRLGRPRRDEFRILLAHTPLYFDAYAEWGADLTLSGHIHGGTIRIPGLGGVMTPQFQFFSKYTRGLLRKGDRSMIISGGLGTHSINVRIANRPELVMITLRRKETESER